MFCIYVILLAVTMATTRVLATLSLNCHGFNNGTVNYLHRVAKDLDFVLLQERGCVMPQSID